MHRFKKIFFKKFHILKKERVLILHDTAGCARVVFAGLGSVKRICAQKVVVFISALGGGPPSGLFLFNLKRGYPSINILFGITLFWE